MSSTTDTTTTEEQTGFHKAADNVLRELPERFEALSDIYIGSGDDESLLIQPTHPYINSDGEHCSHLLMGTDRETLEENGFEFHFATQESKGAGVKFWFKYVGKDD
jgi:hypothetical protein